MRAALVEEEAGRAAQLEEESAAREDRLRALRGKVSRHSILLMSLLLVCFVVFSGLSCDKQQYKVLWYHTTVVTMFCGLIIILIGVVLPSFWLVLWCGVGF